MMMSATTTAPHGRPNGTTATANNPSPKAPPGATKTQLALWQRVLSRRRQQIQNLLPNNFQLFVNDLALELSKSRYIESNNDGDSNKARTDLAVGYYSQLLIMSHQPPAFVTANSAILHIMGLFYRSLDERLSLEQRNHGLDLVKKAFSSLDDKMNEQTLSEKDKNTNNDNVARSREGQDKQQDGGEGPKNKRMRNNNNATISDQSAASLQKESAQSSSLKQPPSPPPKTTLLNPAPDPLPPPHPFRQMTTLSFIPDNNVPTLFSASLQPRSACMLSYNSGYHSDGTGACLTNKLSILVRERLETWDPYWKVVDELGMRHASSRGPHGAGFSVADPSRPSDMTRVGTKTVACTSVSVSNPPVSCAMVSIDLPKEESKSDFAKKQLSTTPWGVKWGQQISAYQTGDRRLLLRTLPLKRTPYDIKKRADTHVWPKGTFLQFSQKTNSTKTGGSSEQVLRISQRRQQSHDPTLWKGMSHALDLSTRVLDTRTPFEVKLCSRERVEEDNVANDQILMGSYAIHAAICEYVDADDLYDRIMGNVAGGDFIIPTMSLNSARKMAKGYLENQTVSIDDSDDDGDDADNAKSPDDDNCLTFSLLCPISKSAMETPVRGQKCKHMQCFDLRNFLHANKTISGGRWRCGVCEDFVSVRDLVRCGLFQGMLDDLRSDVSGIRDRVSLKSDGTWCLLSENKLRYATVQGGGVSSGGKTAEGGVAAEDNNSADKMKTTSEPEVIDLL